MMLSTAANLSTPPKQQLLHLRLPSCPPAPKRQPQLDNNDYNSMVLDINLPTLPALNLKQLDLPCSTPITLKPRRSSNNHKFPAIRSRSPWKAHRTVKHSSRLGSPRLGSANLAQAFANINLTQTTTTSKKRMPKLSPKFSHPPLNTRQQQQQGRHRSASFGSPAA